MAKFIQPELLHLSNGIPVVLQHSDGLVATTYWWVQVGSADESPAEAGFAHFLEHMLFKDAAAKETGMASSGKTARQIEALGGEINAYTSFDQTVYHVTCAAHHWEKVISSFGEMATPQRFLKEDFEREREVILEELRRSEDSPERQLFQTLFTNTYSRHPYGRPVIGYKKTLKQATVARLEHFYRSHYIAGNMGLVLVGPYQDDSGTRKKALLRLLEKQFGALVLPARKRNRFSRPTESVFRKSLQLVKKSFDVTSPSLAFAFRVPELMHADIPALDLLAGVLMMGELSRLYQKLFYQTSLVTEVSGSLYVPKDPGMFFVQIEASDTGKLNPTVEATCQEIRRIREEGVTHDELTRVITNAESERLYATQTADGMAGRLGFLKFVIGDLDFDRRYLEDLRNVDRAKIQEMAKTYLDSHRMAAVLLLPKAQENFDPSQIQKTIAETLGAPAQKKSAAKAGKRGTPVARAIQIKIPELQVRPSGLRIVYRENPLSHVFSIHAVVQGGLRLECAAPVESAESDVGSGHMLSLTWSKGTTTGRDAHAISKMVEGSAAHLEGFSGRNTVGLQLTGLARDWSRLAPLFTEILWNPSFPSDEVEHSRRVAEDAVRAIEDHSSQLCLKLFLETLYDHHPYRHLTMGTLQSLSKIQSSKLTAFHQSWVRPERLVISVVGAIKRSDFEGWLDTLDQQLTAPATLLPSNLPVNLPSNLPEEPPLKGPRWIEKSLQREQLHLFVGGFGTRVNAPDRYALRLLQTVLGGQGGRLFLELRERQSLAYSVAPLSFEGIERGYIGTYIACAPSKKEEALAGIRQVLEKLASKGPTPTEMKRAKEFYLGRRMMELQGDSSLATHYGLQAVYGIPLTEDQQILEKIGNVTAKEIQEACRFYLLDQPQVTSTVG